MDINDTISVTEAAELKGVTRQSIRNAIKAKTLNVVAVVAGRRVLSRAEVEKYKPRSKSKSGRELPRRNQEDTMG